MDQIKQFIKTQQQVIVLIVGYVLVAVIGFGLGRLGRIQIKSPEIKLEDTGTTINNYTPNMSGLQSETRSAGCKIKATTSSRIYHLPGQAGYDKLSGQTCFATEEQAQAAGYRKALK